MKRFFFLFLLTLMVAGLPVVAQAQWDEAQNKWIVGDNDAVFYMNASCTGSQYLLMQGVMEYPILHNISTPGVKSWNNKIACAELGKNAVATVCRVQNYKGTCMELTAGVHSFIGSRLGTDISSIRKTQ
jgi:hypothetical protein